MLPKTDLPKIDTTLTPQNAEKRAYKYMADIMYHEAFPSPEIVELVTEYGHKLGQPSAQNKEDGYTGIYAPLAEH
jgi:hypothetical protein